MALAGKSGKSSSLNFVNPSSVSSLKRNQIWLPNSPIQNGFLDYATWPISLGNSTKGT